MVGLTPGDPAFVTITRMAHRPDGRARTFVQKLVTPPDLFACLLNEVQNGDEVEAVIVTEWHEAGYTTCLYDFQTVETLSSETVRTA